MHCRKKEDKRDIYKGYYNTDKTKHSKTTKENCINHWEEMTRKQRFVKIMNVFIYIFFWTKKYELWL